jgi:hypothetical protein
MGKLRIKTMLKCIKSIMKCIKAMLRCAKSMLKCIKTMLEPQVWQRLFNNVFFFRMDLVLIDLALIDYS